MAAWGKDALAETVGSSVAWNGPLADTWRGWVWIPAFGMFRHRYIPNGRLKEDPAITMPNVARLTLGPISRPDCRPDWALQPVVVPIAPPGLKRATTVSYTARPVCVPHRKLF